MAGTAYLQLVGDHKTFGGEMAPEREANRSHYGRNWSQVPNSLEAARLRLAFCLQLLPAKAELLVGQTGTITSDHRFLTRDLDVIAQIAVEVVGASVPLFTRANSRVKVNAAYNTIFKHTATGEWSTALCGNRAGLLSPCARNNVEFVLEKYGQHGNCGGANTLFLGLARRHDFNLSGDPKYISGKKLWWGLDLQAGRVWHNGNVIMPASDQHADQTWLQPQSNSVVGLCVEPCADGVDDHRLTVTVDGVARATFPRLSMSASDFGDRGDTAGWVNGCRTKPCSGWPLCWAASLERYGERVRVQTKLSHV